jgi:predicted porin
MNKKLIAAAVVAGLAAPMAAQADVSVYGIGQAEISNIDAGGTTGSKTVFGEYGNSRFGIKWSEDLGGGMKAIGQLEWGPKNMYGVQVDTNASYKNEAPGIYGREQWIGLKGGFGAIKLGTIHQAYKYAGGVHYDAFVATAIQARGNYGMLGSSFGQSGYISNSIGYYGKFGMVNFDATYSPVDNTDTGADKLRYSGSKGDMTLALTVGFQGGQAGVAYAKDKNANGTTGPAGPTNTKVFGKYSFGNNTILAQYENSKPDTGDTTKVAYLAYRLKLPAMNMLAVQLGQSKTGGAKNNYAVIGVRHNMSKKTSVFAGYMNKKPDVGDTTKVITVGLTEKF